jgi:hypothetical protein
MFFVVSDFEAALYAALGCYSLVCDPIEVERAWREAQAKLRTQGQRGKGRAPKFNPLALANTTKCSPEEAVRQYPVITDIVAVLRGERVGKKEKEDARGKHPSRRFDLEERFERGRAAEIAGRV